MKFLRSRNRQGYHRHDIQILESKMRAKVKSQRQGKWAVWISVAVFSLVVGGLLAWWGLQAMGGKLFWKNPYYQIREIQVKNPGGSLGNEQVLNYLHLNRGMNLMALNLGQLRSDLELLPVVEKAEISRELPDRLVLRISERIPVANIATPVKALGYQVDRFGMVMDSMFQRRDSEAIRRKLAVLPLLTGVQVSDLKIGRPVPSAEVMQAISLLMRLEQCDFPMDVSVVDLSRPGVLLVKTSQQMMVKFSPRDLDQQLRRLSGILQQTRGETDRIQSVDLTVAGRDVPVIFTSMNSGGITP